LESAVADFTTLLTILRKRPDWRSDEHIMEIA
jgi:hypothetical protein